MFSITEQTATLAHINVRTERHGEEPAALYRRPAPAAGDALPNLPRGWQLALNLAIDAIENAAPAGKDWPVNWPAILHGLTDLRAALAAQVPHKDKGEA